MDRRSVWRKVRDERIRLKKKTRKNTLGEENTKVDVKRGGNEKKNKFEKDST